jgi:diaminopimelate decarboxylase
MIRAGVRALAAASATALPAYITDLPGLQIHANAVRAALPDSVELFYAAKANPQRAILETLDGLVDGIEVASGGELQHVRDVLPEARLAFGGPGKSADDLELAVKLGVERIHVESVHELRLLADATERQQAEANVLLRVNLPLRLDDAALTMGGPFGMDPAAMAECTALLRIAPRLRFHGVHAHLASGLDADQLARLAGEVVDLAKAWAERQNLPLREVNLGGGMDVDYTTPSVAFDWPDYGAALGELAEANPDLRLRIEPGRSITAYCGYYAARVLDVKLSHGQAFAILHGGTHHLRTPVAKSHDQPFGIVPVERWHHPWPRPGVTDGPVTLVGQLCTPKDVFARDVPVQSLKAGDVVVFALAGAYAWNISHHEFLMHPAPAFYYLGRGLGRS